MVGSLAGIARHGAPKAPMETVVCADVTMEGGIAGDFRGTVKPGGRGRRQVTLIALDDWNSALAEIDRDIAWFERRANLLVDGVRLPRTAGSQIRIGDDVILQVTMETEPCKRMDEVAAGLWRALTPDWRGGICSRVLSPGRIAVGDAIRIEES